MNRRQRISLVVGAAVVVLMVLCPPWEEELNSRHGGVEWPRGYAFVFWPRRHDPNTSLRVDQALLRVQIGAVVLATVGLTVAFKNEPSKEQRGGGNTDRV